MKGRWSRNHTYILTGVIAASILIFFISSSQVISPLKAEAELLQTQSEMYTERLGSLTGTDPDESEEEMESLERKIPLLKSIDSALVILEETARESGADILFVGTDPNREAEEAEEKEGNLGEAYFIVDASAESLEAMHQFIDGIIGNERLFRVDSMEMEHTEAGVFLTMHITAFHQVQH